MVLIGKEVAIEECILMLFLIFYGYYNKGRTVKAQIVSFMSVVIFSVIHRGYQMSLF